ncbi:hypothetical protein HRbin35_00076 [bacterium HR35]|nr:hypothetical protein HRbin35_00076 [bacterium HR35]
MNKILIGYLNEFLDMVNKELNEKFPNPDNIQNLAKIKEEVLKLAESKNLQDFSQLQEIIIYYYEKLKTLFPEEELNSFLTQISQKLSQNL